jgi:hypothetical protein
VKPRMHTDEHGLKTKPKKISAQKENPELRNH